MYIDIDDNDNLDEPCMATFAENGPTAAVARIRLWHEGAWQWCAVCAWNANGPQAASITPIEESGDGPALLVHGGDWGLRLAVVGGPDAADPSWDLDDDAQWAEPFLICRPDIVYH